METNCGLCQCPIQENEGNILGGMRLCDQCFLGDLQRTMENRWGWTISIRETSKQRHKLPTLYFTDFQVRFNGNSQLRMNIRRRSMFIDPVGYFSRRITVGDPLFDNFANVRTNAFREVTTILSNDGVQNIIMDLLGDIKKVEIRGDKLVTRRVTDEYDPPQRVLVEIAVLAAYFDQKIDT